MSYSATAGTRNTAGAIAIPAAVAEHVLERAEALGTTEVEIRRELGSGLTLADALAKFGHV